MFQVNVLPLIRNELRHISPIFKRCKSFLKIQLISYSPLYTLHKAGSETKRLAPLKMLPLNSAFNFVRMPPYVHPLSKKASLIPFKF